VNDLFGQKIEKKPWYSPSRLKTFLQCSRKYQYMVVLKLPTLPSPHLDLGNNVHAALKDWMRLKPADRNWDKLLELYRAAWRQNKKAFDNRTRDELRDAGEKGKAMLRRFMEETPPDLEPVMTERNVNADYGDVMLGGRVDRVDALEDGSLRVIDYKTGKFPARPQRERDEDLAAPVYARAVSNAFAGAPVREVELLYLDTFQRIVFDVDEIWQAHKDLAVIEAVHAVREAERADVFPARTSVLCGWCDFKGRCPEGKAFLDASPDQH